MAYEGYEVPIAIGSLGLHTDGPQSQLPPNAAITANNVSFFTGTVSKSPGTVRFNTTTLGNPIVCGFDWWPTASTQRTVVATSDGKIWKDTGDGTFSSGVPLVVNETQLISFAPAATAGSVTWKWNGNSATGSNTGGTDTAAQVQTQLRTITGLSLVTVAGDWATGFTVFFPGTSTSQPLITTSANTLTGAASAAVTITVTHIQQGATLLGTITTDTFMIPGGAEVANNPRRLFIFTGTSQVAMMTGDSSAVTGITKPAADWASTFPTFGVQFNNRLCAAGNSNSPHTLYICRQGDHTDFSTSETDGTGAAQYPIFPGEGDGLIGAVVFKGGLLLFKRPFGMYLFQWNGGDINDVNNVSISRLSDAFALTSPHAAVQVLDDLLGGASSGSLFSQKATQAYGSLESGDLMLQAQVRNYFRQNFAYGGLPKMQTIYYPEKVLAMFSGRDNTASPQNRILMYDSAGQSPRISVETKDQPTSMWLRKDTNFVPRPFYGADDGFVYQMDQSAANVNGLPYTGEFQTPFIDFSYLDPKLSEKVKLFEFLAITYQNVGNWSFFADIFVDGAFVQTVKFPMKQSASALDSFVLDKDRLGATNAVLTLRQPLKSCAGKTISIRIYNDQLNQTFIVERIIISFRESGEQNRSSKS